MQVFWGDFENGRYQGYGVLQLPGRYSEKSPLAAPFTIQNDNRADFWEFPTDMSTYTGQVEILESPLATECIVSKLL